MIKKVHPHIKPLFSCHHSLKWISEYAHNALLDNNVPLQHLWVSDNNEQCFNGKIPQDDVVDILLTGSFFLRMLELPYWPVKQIRLWTLCPDIRTLISKLFKIPKETIGLIPHPSIPSHTEQKELKHLVYAGRLSWGKNIEALLALVSHLQHDTHPHLELTLYGEKSDLPEESFGRITEDEFNIESLINLYPWKKRPLVKGNDPEWFKKLDHHSHYISLSTSMYEDFALSPSEAAQSKTSLILSQWGGHKYKEGAQLLSQSLIFKSFEPTWVKKEKTRLLAHELQHSTKQGQAFAFESAQTLSHHEISTLVMNYIQKNSPEILLCFREALETYADTFKGRNFFYLYQKHFSSFSHPETIVFYSEEAHQLELNGQVMFVPSYDSHLPEVTRMRITAQTILGEKDSIVDG